MFTRLPQSLNFLHLSALNSFQTLLPSLVNKNFIFTFRSLQDATWTLEKQKYTFANYIHTVYTRYIRVGMYQEYIGTQNRIGSGAYTPFSAQNNTAERAAKYKN